RSTSAAPCIARPLPLVLHPVRMNDGRDQAGEALIDFVATRRVVHLHAPALAADQARFAQGFEVLRHGGLRDGAVAYLQEGGAGVRALASRNLREDVGAHRVGQGMQDAFDRNVFNGWVKQGPHQRSCNTRLTRCPTWGYRYFTGSVILNYCTRYGRSLCRP